MVSAELNEMETLSRRLDTCSDEVKELRRALTALIDTTTWTGRAADEFRDKWRTEFNPVLTNMADALTTEGQEVRKRRDRFDFAGNHK